MIGTVTFCDSRRTNFEKCLWWNQTNEDKNIPLSKVAHNRREDGSFWAEEESPEQESSTSSGDFERTMRTVTISTSDDIFGKLHKNDLVRYNKRIWRVVSVSLQKEWRRTQFSRNNNCGTKIITLVC